MPPEDLNMAAHQHLKTNTHTHTPQPQTQRLCVYYTKVRRLERHQIPVLELLSLFFRYFHFFDLLLLFFGLFLVLNFFLPTQILQEKWCFCFQARAVQTLQSKSSLVHTELRISLFTHTACRRLTDEAVPRRVS